MQQKTIDVVERARLLNYETPFFFTVREKLKQNYQEFTGLFDNVEVYYALKANSEPTILTYLNEQGCGFEAASAFEVKLLLDLGVAPEKIIYGTSIKPADHIEQTFKWGIDRFAADSKEEIEKVAASAPGSRVFIRTIVDDAGSVFMMSNRFGAPANAVSNLILYARELGLKTYGISFYVGSQAAHSNMWAKGIHVVKPIMEELEKRGVTLEMLNIGGGFPVKYHNHRRAPNLYDIVVSTHNALHTLPYIPKILMEPGRGIVASTTALVTTIIARNDRAQRPWLCLDAGVYNALFEAMIHQGATRYIAHPFNPPEGRTEKMLCTIAGPTGDSLDIVGHSVELPSYMNVGDKLIFENVGAYTTAMGSHFNGFPKVPLYIS
ncbi:MAG TPA: type III PLP-dependent enzyme [Candidatus Saccharimonadales bacterium]|nr:type III PLP-dependent enzyme [Candidatus Saccharimonadales bacterium]